LLVLSRVRQEKMASLGVRYVELLFFNICLIFKHNAVALYCTVVIWSYPSAVCHITVHVCPATRLWRRDWKALSLR